MASNPVGIASGPSVEEKRASLLVIVQEQPSAMKAMVASVVRRAYPKGSRDEIRQRAEDLHSEIITRALEKAENYDPTRPVMSWLFGIARNVLRDDCKKLAAQSRPPSRSDVDDAAWDRINGIASSRADGTSESEFDDLMGGLDPSSRRALKCRYFLGLDGQELAEALGTTREAARGRVHRALNILRRRYISGAGEAAR